MLSPGSTFAHFQIQVPLGSGAMGAVYQALDTRLDRLVALKLINPGMLDEDELRRRLSEEAKRSARIDSPHVVKVWEFDEHDGELYLSLEFAPGRDLRGCLAELSFEDKLSVALQLARGLKAAHEAGVLHLDLKPENVRISHELNVKILDFGLAALIDAGTLATASETAGTLLYASPEQLKSEAVSQRSDLFSLGVMFYEMFTGRLPFEADFTGSVVYSVLYEEPGAPQEVNPDIPDWLHDLIMVLMAKEPDQRPPDAGLIEARIRSAMEPRDDFILAHPPLRRRRSATILRLKNQSGDSSWDYLCSGFTEDLIAELTRRSDLIVGPPPETSDRTSIRRAFDLFRTDYIVSGSLMRLEQRIRISLKVYGDKGDSVISDNNYEGTIEDFFGLLETAAAETAEVLAVVSGTAPGTGTDASVADVSAYDYYLKGRAYYQTSRPEDLDRAEALFRKALEIDPYLAAAHTGLSDLHTTNYIAYRDRTPERIGAARDEAKLALEIDARLPEAHRAMGRYYQHTGNFARAEEALRAAIEHDPKYALGYRTLAWLKHGSGELDVALRWAVRALQLAPTDLETLLLVGLIHMDREQFTPAIATLQRAIELGPDYGRAHYLLGAVYMRMGKPDLAAENLRNAVKFQGDPNAYIDAAYAYLVAGDHEEADRHYAEAIRQDQMAFIACFYLGCMAVGKDEHEASRIYFEKALSMLDDLDPEGSDVHLSCYRAATLAWNGDYKEAENILRKVSGSSGLTGNDFFCLAQACIGLGDKQRALEFRGKAVARFDGPTAKEAELDPLWAIRP